MYSCRLQCVVLLVLWSASKLLLPQTITQCISDRYSTVQYSIALRVSFTMFQTPAFQRTRYRTRKRWQ